MKILLFGKYGQVAWELQRSLSVLGLVKTLGSDVADFSNPEGIRNIIREYKPEMIVNAAAYTAVDKAESEEELANVINGHTVGVIAEEAKRLGAKFIHYSTDYVFDGTKAGAFTEKDTPNPLNAYGRGKLIGEQLITDVGGSSVILRVSWIYGIRGNNFYKTMLRLGAERESLTVVNDQIGAPTWSRHIADATARILADRDFKSKTGLYHLAPQGSVSWCGFAQAIFETTRRLNVSSPIKIQNVSPILSKDYPVKALRPLNSAMSSVKICDNFGIKLPHWQQSLELVVSDLAV